MDNSPAADEIHLVASVMTDDLMLFGIYEDDIPRVLEAFNHYGRSAEKWPTSFAINETMKQLSHQRYMTRQSQKTLPEPEEVKQRRKQTGQQAIQTMKSVLSKSPIAQESVQRKRMFTEQQHRDMEILEKELDQKA